MAEPVAARFSSFGNRALLRNWLAVLATVTLAIIAVGTLLPPVPVDNLVYDLAIRLRRRPPDPRILIVAIDDPSLAELGRWPWGRAVHARAVRQMAETGVAAIAYDVLFPEAEAPAADDDLAAAIRAEGRVALPVLLEVPGRDGRAAEWRLPVPALAAAAAGLGHVVIRPDRDGIVRGAERLESVRGAALPQLMQTLVALARGDAVHRGWPQAAAEVRTAGRALIDFAGPSGSYPRLSFADLLAGRAPAELLRGRIILVGATAAGLGDRFSTPVSTTKETMAGVELLANYADNLLHGDTIRAAAPWLWLGYSLLPVWCLMLSLVWFGPRVNLWLGGTLALAVLLVTLVALLGFGLWLPPALALLAIGVIYPLWGWRRLVLASSYMVRELRELRAEGSYFRRERSDVAGDPVRRQIALMHAAVTDVRDLRRFIAQSLESLPDAAVVSDADGRVVIANDAAERLFRGRLDSAPVGRALADLLHCLRPAAAAWPEGWPVDSGALPDAHAETAAELDLAGGVALDVRVAPFRDDGQRLLGWIARFVDISGIRAAEREREDTLRLLTHDMRAPQAAILAVLDAEGAAVPPQVAARLQRYAQQTLELADGFVNLARAKSGRLAQDLVNLPDCALDAADDLWPLAQRQGIRIRTQLPAGELLVLGDRALLTRALGNILSNAIKYSGAGADVAVRFAVEPGMAVCSVADTGRGIAAADLGDIFEPFRRAAAADGQIKVQGTGLGLAFVKTVAERHGGGVSAQSAPGAGTTITLRLPQAPA